jgi:hypothetical protein
LAIVLSVLLRLTDSDYRFGIFKLFSKIREWTQVFRKCKQFKLKLSLTVATMSWLTVTEWISAHKCPRIYSVCCNHNPLIHGFSPGLLKE